jgi:hypothetical protein
VGKEMESITLCAKNEGIKENIEKENI